jgi:hypothetical protein
MQQRRNAKTLRELAPLKTPGQDAPLPKLSRTTLLAALTRVAAYIRSKGGNVRIVAVGGAVNTIHLQSRGATHDLDFFNNELTAADYEYLVNGAKEAARRDKLLEEQWFNNRTILFIPMDQRDTLTQQSFQQGEVIFQEPGLTVFAAPWSYAFCCKVDRLAGGGVISARSYDLSDAVQYLGRYLAGRDIARLRASMVQEWFAQYCLRWTANNDRVLPNVNREYRRIFKLDFDVIV